MAKKEKVQDTTPVDETKLDPYSLDNIDGLGPVRKQKLLDNGITTMFDVAVSNPTQLQQIMACEMPIVEKVFKTCKSYLESNEFIWKSDMTAVELLHKRKTLHRLKTGCSGLDTILDGGIEERSITEFYGKNGSGKSQLGHKLSIMAQLPTTQGGLHLEGEKPPITVIIDTENKYSPERMIKILLAMGLIEDLPNDLKKKAATGNMTDEEKITFDDLRTKQEKDAEKYLANIHIKHPRNAAEQLFALKKVRSWLSAKLSIKLIIIDSTVALFRGEMSERGTSWRKKDLMNEMLLLMRGIAETFNVVLVSMNQIYNSPDQQFGDGDVPYGGNLLGHALGTRIKFEKTNGHVKIGSGSNEKRFVKNIAIVKKSPLRGPDEIQYYIEDSGLVDVP